MISFRQAKKSFKKALSLHEEVKTLLNDCQNTRDQSFQYMEAGRAYWVMAQMQSESEDWKQP